MEEVRGMYDSTMSTHFDSISKNIWRDLYTPPLRELSLE